MPAPVVWTQLKSTGNIPSNRSGHTLTTVGKSHILFGGLDNCSKKGGKLFPNNQVYSLRIVQNNCEWRIHSCSGDIPLPRTKHSACAIGNDKLFVFGGYYSSSQRLNDVYILKTVGEFQWKQPKNQKSGGEPKNAESKIGAPEPRANHSCTYHRNKVYVFGGHGGVDYQRTSFNDIYYFDCDSEEWTKIEDIGGNPPWPRGGHSAALLSDEDKIIIYGGWSQISQFSDVIIYDIKKNEWIDPELSHDIPRWNHSGIMVPAIPSWKYFIFGGSVGNFEEGGNRTLSKMTDDAYVLDIQSMKWGNINLESAIKPKSRENSAMIYDSNESRCILFGGWANQWMQDIYALNIGLITGPPYAIYSIDPCLGPLTGRSKINIKGNGFKDSSNILVRFSSGKTTSPEVQGNFISESELWCETPNFEQFGPRMAEITLSMNKGDYTITSVNFQYFLNTKAQNTIAYGPGLLSENCCGFKSVFVIQARNTKGQNRESGRDEFQVKIMKNLTQQEWDQEIEKVMQKEIEKPEEERTPVEEIKKQIEEQLCIPFKIIDKNDGSYFVEYQMDEEVSNLIIDVSYQDEHDQFVPIRGNPFRASWKRNSNPKNNDLAGPVMLNYITKSLNDFENLTNEARSNINIKNRNIENVFELLSVKENLQEISEKKEKVVLELDVIEQCLLYLEKMQVNKDQDLRRTQKSKEDWNNLQKMAVTVEKDISVPVKAESDKAKDNLFKFEEQMKEYYMNMKKESFYQYKTGLEESMERIQVVNKKIEFFAKTLKDFEYFSKMFNFDEALLPAQKNLEQIKNEVKAVTKIWEHIQKCQAKFEEYLSRKWVDVDCVEMEDEVKKLKKELVDQRGIDKRSNVFLGINDDIKKWATFLPLCGELKDPSMDTSDERHWLKIKNIVKKDFKIDENLKLYLIWELKLFEFKDSIEEITDQSKNELKMEKAIKKIISKWQEVEFEPVRHKDTNIYTLKMIEENFEQLEEHQLQINNMLLSKYIGFFEKETEKWKQDLGAVYDVVQLLNDVQKSWSFLENLFIHSEEVKKELPKESEQFVGIDNETKSIMSEGNQIKNVLKFCTTPNMLKRLDQIQVELKVCEKALNEFLDGKRRAFPRFYFVSVADLLDILSNGNSPEKINRHMPKIFQAIEKLEMVNDGDRPIAKKMITCVGQEEVNFVKDLKLTGKVEVYLTDVIDTMIHSLQHIAKTSIQAHGSMKREDWIKRDPSQITLLINLIIWVEKVEQCFKKIQQGDLEALKNYYKESVNQLTDLIKMVQGQLPKDLRQKLMCLITLDTHSRDVMEKLINENVRKPEEFQWQSQLKFYWEKDDARVKIADAAFWYSYEYLGNGPRLVVTPLTDRIYVTATQALHLCMGCAPAGPAGTGKTETTKDLASALAKACYVFNCSGEMNYESMGNIFKGLASSGCWGCFDEFNRLIPEVLSVCSVQFKAVTDAIKYKRSRFILEGDEISLNPTCGVFITMNPGYLGRSELPEGLKALFRPITVVVPDLQLICENMLMAEGFVEAKTLSLKFVTLYTLCKDLLSKSDHYDWGLRAIKSVLVVAGSFKRAEPDISEEALLYRALRDFNLPKIIAADLEIFFGLLNDLFPGVNIQRKRDVNFEKIIEQTCQEQKLYPEPEFILKVVQLQELLEIRHCVFVMGPPGSGKTSTWRTLAKSFDKAGKKTSYVDLNPKVVSTRDLYGYNLPSKEWKDGLLSKLMRTYAEMEDSHPKWLLLDGDLDANWIESMNSVMDDNKILTLANNERIPLKPHMRMIFEIRDLKFATPATVSRAGILYISDDSGHQWKSYVKSWIQQSFKGEQNAEVEFRNHLQMLFDRYVEGTLTYIKRSCKFIIPITHISMVASLCRSLYPLLTKTIVSNIEYLFIYALIWAIGGALTEKDGVDYRKEFSSWWKSEWKTSVKFPSKGTVYDYYVSTNEQGASHFDEWTKKIQAIDFDTQQGMQMSQITVPTKETVSTSEFVKTYILVQHPVLLIGQAGCGKTQLAMGILREIIRRYPENYTFQSINFNFYTDSPYLQSMLEQQLEKKAGRQFGPFGKMKMIYYIDDMNMPQLDLYNTQTAIALLRQHADYQHWYDINKLSLKDIINTQHLASMNPSAGSFSVNPRYQRHFWIVSVPFPDNESLFLIYNTFLNGHLKHFRSTVQEFGAPIIKAALQLHTHVVNSFKKTAINFHYEFNIRHIANSFAGILITNPNQFQEPEKLVKLWIHESERTYADRLVSQDNLATYKAGMFDLLKKNFSKFNFSKYFQQNENLIFCDFCSGLNGDRVYDWMQNDKLEHHIAEALKEYNDNMAYMGLVLFEDALKHVCRITRIIKQPSGHALLVGVGGSGKQSLAKLSAFIMGYTVFSITISATYSMGDLRSDLQVLYQKSGIKDEGMLFLFTEGQITNERFLVYINDLLSSGEIAELYQPDEKEVIINNVRPKVKADGISDSRENCWGWYIDKVKQNLHMALCFSPVGESFRRRARQFPALVNCSVIDWFHPWPAEALLSVGENFLKETDLGDESVRNAVVNFMPYSFQLVNSLSVQMLEQEKRHIYTTPKSFLELIKLYITMLKNKRQDLDNNKEKYETGLIKLKETAEQVAEIEEDVKVKQVEAEAKKIEADAFAETVGAEKEKVEAEQSKANAEADKCSIIQKDVSQQASDTQADLDAALPLAEQAKKALEKVDKKDFQTVKSFASPPTGIPEVFAASMYLMAGHWNEAIDVDKSKKPKSVEWKSALKMMKNPDELKDKLVGFKDIVDSNQVNPACIQIVKAQYLSLPDFEPEKIANKSTAARAVCDWVINTVKYWEVIQTVEPKRKALKEATEQLEEATIKLNIINEIVREKTESLNKLVAEFNQAQAIKNAAISEAERCARRLNLANRLVNALGSENERWGNSIIELDKALLLLVGDVLLASAFISYSGPFNKKFREIMINKSFIPYLQEKKIPMSKTINPVKLMTDEAQIATWNKQGLPSDTVSVENGTILTFSERYPLLIDPQLQGNVWIREKEKDNHLKCVRLGSKNLIRDMEMSIENGYSAMIENMDERIDAILMPVIARAFIRRGRKRVLQFGGKDLELHDNFRLFLHTKLSNPHYPPEIQAESTMINFTVTEEGLGDQLLTLVVGRERPDLAKKKIKLITQQNDFKIKLKELETELLFKLANAKGDILDDIELIENLEKSKKISVEVARKVEIAKVTEIKINESSEAYRNAASRGALFYFLLTDLAKIHSFYKYSLESFIVVINRAIDLITEKKQDDLGNLDEDQEKIQQRNLEDNEQQQKQDDTSNKRQEEQKTQQEDENQKNEGEEIKEGQEDKQEEGNQENNQEKNEDNSKEQQIEGEKQQNQTEEKKDEETSNKEDNQSKEDNQKNEEGQEQVQNQDDDEDAPLAEAMSPRSLKKRVDQLIDSITYTSFLYTRRGLFEKHKTIVSSMLTLRILLREEDEKKRLSPEEVNHLIIGKLDPNPTPLPDVLKNFLSEPIWAACRALENLQPFQNFCSSLEIDSLQWKKWYNEEKAEIADLPKAFKEMSKFHRLLLLRAMRPDRLPSALVNFIGEMMGDKYVEQQPFNIFSTYEETNCTTPIFFVLFPGVDPTPDVEAIGAKNDISISNGKFINISMGQGQEDRAKNALFEAAKNGTWVMLQNLHLMQSWLYGLNGLEGFLEQCFATAHPNFRAFFSSEPPPLPDWVIIPESVLQASLKVANESPQDLKANLKRAYAKFSQEFIDKSPKQNEFKAILFALCFFHSLVLGRKKFGSQGWSRNYNFNDGDLTICADVLHNYLSSYDVVPYDDLRYIYGEIMYGGHITDNWDRRTNATYLKVLIRAELLSNMNLAPQFKSPDPSKLDYSGYINFIETKLPVESPLMFGLHPNAEIGYLTQQCEAIFNTVMEISGGGGGSGGGKKDSGVMNMLMDLKSKVPAEYNMIEINMRIQSKSPDIVVCLQECDRMNLLLSEIRNSLEDLRLGMTGALNMTESMENLQIALQFNRVPASWEKVAYFSKKLLAMWFIDLIDRNIQLSAWSKELNVPNSLCIAYLFNPMSFLTAIMQSTARKNKQPLDSMSLQTDVTQMRMPDEVTNPAENGAFIHGFYLEGAAWEIGGQGQQGYLIDQKMKELHPKLPIVNIISVPVSEKKQLGQYTCPVYVTSMRGPTFVFSANLNMESEESDPNKWILAGVCLLLSDD